MNIEKKKFSIVLLFLSIVFSVFLIEGVLRLAGYTPWTYWEKDLKEPTMHESDSVLGWRNKEGKYVVPAYSPAGQDIHMTFIGRGQRLTRNQENDSKKELVIVGGSYTQGWAIDDNETYPWKLQTRYPSLNVLNYGTGGYGSFQSLLVLEQELPRLSSPVIVLYGFILHHEDRNVAPGAWLQSLSKYSRRGHVLVSYGTLDDDRNLVRHSPERYLALPFRESTATIPLIEKAYMKIKSKKRHAQKREVTEQVLLEMKRTTDLYGATFVVVFLLEVDNATKHHYSEFFQAHNINNIHCGFPRTPDMKIPGDGHPNGKMNSLYADCIVKGLGDQMEMYQ